MRHPFDGLNGPAGEQPSRRSALGALAGTAAGLLGLGGVAAAQQKVQIQVQVAPPVQITTLAIGEEGGPMTKAVNEAGGPAPALVTTEPFGEEAGKVVSRAVPGLEDGVKPAAPVTEARKEAGGAGGVTTQAVGEEGGVLPTQAINEQGGPTTKALNEEGARATTNAINEEGAIATTRAVGEEAGRVTAALREGGLTRALNETGGPIVPVQPNTTNLTEEQMQAQFKELTDKDAARGVQACAVLYGSKNVVKFLEKNLTVEKYRLPQAGADMVAKLIANLDSDDFGIREKAEADLAKLGPAVSAALEKAIKQSKSAEQMMRLQRLLEASKNPAHLTQAKRGLEVLVALRTDEAKELLRKLSRGKAEEWLTQMARAALDRAAK